MIQNGGGLSLDALLDTLAERVAAKVRADLTPDGSPTVTRPRLLSVDQAAAYLGRTKASVQHMVAEGSFPAVRADRRVFLDREDLDRWIEANKQPGVI